jgi:CDGSH-type Zn-finger protein
MPPLTITVKRTGPYIIALEECSGVRIVDHEGNELIPEPNRPIKLCRCGGSASKPFCDGTHKRIGFLATPASEGNLEAQSERGADRPAEARSDLPASRPT